MNPTLPDAADPRFELRRVRHETRRRTLTVSAVHDITPGMRRISLHAADLADFVSLGADDHIKLFLPDGAGGAVMRDYTPRRYDNAAPTLDIDFALHDEAGPATAWAMRAKVGDTLEIGGPRGSLVVPETFDWYLLVGDETALPAIGRRLEELPPRKPVVTVVSVATSADIQAIATPADWTGEWICRDNAGAEAAQALTAAIDRLMPQEGDGFVWIAAEATLARTLRAHLIEAHRHPPRQMRAAGYWVRGDAGAHHNLD